MRLSRLVGSVKGPDSTESISHGAPVALPIAGGRDDALARERLGSRLSSLAACGWVADSVQAENRGFNLISRRPHPEDPKTFIEVRFIEVKGRAGGVALSETEYLTDERLKGDYWRYGRTANVPRNQGLQCAIRHFGNCTGWCCRH